MITAALGGIRATIFAGIAVAAIAFSGWQMVAKNHYKNQIAKQDTQHRALVQNLLMQGITEHKRISDDYEKDLLTVEAKRRDVTRKLHTAEYKLQQHWTCPVTDASGAEEARKLREEAAGRIIAIGAEADAKERRLIDANEKLESTIEAILRSR